MGSVPHGFTVVRRCFIRLGSVGITCKIRKEFVISDGAFVREPTTIIWPVLGNIGNSEPVVDSTFRLLDVQSCFESYTATAWNCRRWVERWPGTGGD
jgi:carbonic anhydrase/acetyltransferase-like protein (isoleucine patch superfamily)